MILYKSIVKEVLKYCSITLSVIVVLHIAITLIVSNALYYNTITMFTLCLISLLVIITLSCIILWSARHTNKLYIQLEEKCDPKGVLDELDKYFIDSLTNKTIISLNILKFTCYFRAGLYKEAKSLVESFRIEKETTKSNTIILWNHNKVMLCIASYDDYLEEYRNEFNQLRNKYAAKSSIIDMYIAAQNKYCDLFNVNLDNLDKYYIEALNESTKLIEKVSYNNNLTKIYYRQNKYEEALKCAQFVVANANTMYALEESKQIIGKIKKEV